MKLRLIILAAIVVLFGTIVFNAIMESTGGRHRRQSRSGRRSGPRSRSVIGSVVTEVHNPLLIH